MRAARSPHRTQTTAGALSHRRPDRTYSTPPWCEPDRRPSARSIRRSGRHVRSPNIAQNTRRLSSPAVPPNAGCASLAIVTERHLGDPRTIPPSTGRECGGESRDAEGRDNAVATDGSAALLLRDL